MKPLINTISLEAKYPHSTVLRVPVTKQNNELSKFLEDFSYRYEVEVIDGIEYVLYYVRHGNKSPRYVNKDRYHKLIDEGYSEESFDDSPSLEYTIDTEGDRHLNITVSNTCLSEDMNYGQLSNLSIQLSNIDRIFRTWNTQDDWGYTTRLKFGTKMILFSLVTVIALPIILVIDGITTVIRNIKNEYRSAMNKRRSKQR